MAFSDFLRGRLRHALTEEEKQLLEGLVEQTEFLSERKVILTRGQNVDYSTILIEGFMLRTIWDTKGKRHVVGIQVPGDFADLHAFALKRLDHDLVTVGPARLGYVPHDRLQRVVETQPHLTRLLWFSTLLDAAIHREWIMKMETLKGEKRLAHLIVELWHRLDFVGRAERDGFHLPLTQNDLADACGTTPVHMNRILSQLRREGLLDIGRGWAATPDLKKLAERGEFEPEYLYAKGMVQPQAMRESSAVGGRSNVKLVDL